MATRISFKEKCIMLLIRSIALLFFAADAINASGSFNP